MDPTINWNQMFSERRCKLLSVDTEDVIWNFLEDTGKIASAPMIQKYDLPPNWVCRGVYFSHRVDRFEFVIVSDEFDKVPVGGQTPLLDPNRDAEPPVPQGVPCCQCSKLTQTEKQILFDLCDTALEAEMCSQFRNILYVVGLRKLLKKLGRQDEDAMR